MSTVYQIAASLWAVWRDVFGCRGRHLWSEADKSIQDRRRALETSADLLGVRHLVWAHSSQVTGKSGNLHNRGCFINQVMARVMGNRISTKKINGFTQKIDFNLGDIVMCGGIVIVMEGTTCAQQNNCGLFYTNVELCRGSVTSLVISGGQLPLC